MPRLRSISQDLRVQHLHNGFAVEAGGWGCQGMSGDMMFPTSLLQAHEYWAQVALESGDFRAFNTAAQELEATQRCDKKRARKIVLECAECARRTTRIPS